jgi:hypothetical protein
VDLRVFAGLTAMGLLLQGCAEKAQPVAPPPVPRPAYGPPPAEACAVTPFTLAQGGTTAVSLNVANDCGYCPVEVTQANGKPFDAGLEPVRPANGHAPIRTWLGKTSINYAPNAGFTGTDHFTVRLLVRGLQGYTTLNVTATVLPKGAPLPGTAPSTGAAPAKTGT